MNLEIRKLAAEIGSAHELGLELWQTGNLDARLLSILLVRPKQIPGDDLDRMVRSATCAQVADWLNSYIVRKHPDGEKLRERWMADNDPWAARAGWSLTSERLVRSARSSGSTATTRYPEDAPLPTP